MNKLSRIFLAVGVLALAVSGQDSETISGYVTDTLCGKKGANARHVDCLRW